MKVHLCCGASRLPGWVNLDWEPSFPEGHMINDGRPDHWMNWNLERGFPVFGQVEMVFWEHAIEHFDYHVAANILRGAFKAMKSGAVVRSSTPDLVTLVKAAYEGRLSHYAPVGFVCDTPAALINQGMRMWGHKYVYDEQELRKLLSECGFVDIKRCSLGKSEHAALNGIECRPDLGDLVMEATKP